MDLLLPPRICRCDVNRDNIFFTWCRDVKCVELYLRFGMVLNYGFKYFLYFYLHEICLFTSKSVVKVAVVYVLN